MTATVLAWYDVEWPGFALFLDFVVLPLFLVIVATTIVIAVGILIFSGMNGYFCLPGGFNNHAIDQGILDAVSNRTAYLVANTPYLAFLRALSRNDAQENPLTLTPLCFMFNNVRWAQTRSKLFETTAANWYLDLGNPRRP
jgi:hypothetical protein